MKNHQILALFVAFTAVSACGGSTSNGTAGSATGGSPSQGGGAGIAGSGGTHSNGGAGATGGTQPSNGGAGIAGSGGTGGIATQGGAGGNAGTGGDAGDGGTNAREFFYIATVVNDDIVLGSVEPPAALSSSPRHLSTGAEAIAVDATQTFVYVAVDPVDLLGGDGHIDTYRINTDGSLPAQPSSSITHKHLATSIALDPKGRFAYANGGDPGLEIFTIDPVTGALTNTGLSATSNGSFIAIDPTGQFLYVSDRGIHGFHIDQTTGALTELAGSPFGATGVPKDASVFGGGIVFKPSGDFLYTSGASAPPQFTGALNAFKVGADGKLTLVTGSPFTLDVDSDAHAPDIAMDPRGDYLYVTNFNFTHHVSGFKIDPTSGALTPAPGPVTASSAYSVAVDPSGRFVFVGEDGMNTRVYSLNRGTGALNELASSPFAFGGFQPKFAFATLP